MRLFNIVFKRLPQYIHTAHLVTLIVILLRCLIKSKFTEFGRDRAYFDFETLIPMGKYNLNVASGYKATMDTYGTKTLLCSELCHKLINMQTVWDLMERMYRDHGPDAYKEKVTNYLVGLTVMTSYNNKTYRIDDINWNVDPTTTFDKRGGNKISFLDYYFEHYKISIREPKQPLLVSKIKMRKKPAGAPAAAAAATSEPETMDVLLVPELCVLTGTVLLKEFERDFTMKKELDAITKLNPDVRYARLRQFIEKITRNPETKKDLEDWQMDFASDVVKVDATVLPTVTVAFGNVLILYNQP